MNLEALIPSADEFALLTCAIDGGADIAAEIVATTPATAFGDDSARELFAVVESVAATGGDVDMLAVFRAWSKRHGRRPIPPMLQESQKIVATPTQFPHFAKSVLDAHRRRTLQSALVNILTHINSPQHDVATLVAEAEAALGSEAVEVAMLNARESATALANDLERRHQLQGALSGISTGFPALDRMLDGLQPGEQTIFAARPSIGKTAIALNVVAAACLGALVPTLFVSCEMTPASLCRRLLSGMKEIGMGSLRSGRLDEFEFTKAGGFTVQLAQSPLWILDGISGIDCARLAASARRLVRQHGIKLIVVDYLQKVGHTERKEKRTYEVAEVSGALRSLAVNTGAALMTLAQLSRESEKDKGRLPRLSDLADCGQIERDADSVVLLHRDRAEAVGEATLIVAKQRDGQCGNVTLKFNGPFCRFENA